MKFLRCLGALCATIAYLQGAAYGATVTVSGNAALSAAAHAAADGDVILLADGNYGAVQLDNIVLSGAGVTIKPVAGAHPVLTGLGTQYSRGLTFQGLEIQMAPTQQYGAYVYGGTQIGLDGLTVHQADGSLGGVGVFVRDSAQVTLSNSEVHHVGTGASIMDTVGASVVGNRFHDLQTDGVDLPGDPGFYVAFNVFTDFQTVAGDHPDAIQGWSTAAHSMPSGGTVKGNVFRRGLSNPALPPQGIFFEYQANLSAIGNALSCTLANGISFSGVATGLIEGNWDQGCSDFGSRIIVRDGSDSVTVRGNWVSQPLVNLVQSNSAPNTNFTDGGQTTIPGIVVPPAGTAPDTAAMDQWITAHITSAIGTTSSPTTQPPIPITVVDPTIAPNAQIASLTAQVTTLTGQVATLTGQLTAAQSKITALRASESQIKTLAAQGKAAPAKSKNGYFDQIATAAAAALALP